MSKTPVALFSRRGENYVSGSIENLARGNVGLLAELAAAQSECKVASWLN